MYSNKKYSKNSDMQQLMTTAGVCLLLQIQPPMMTCLVDCGQKYPHTA